MAEETTKRKVNRSAAYPGVSLQEAVEATKLLRDNLGAGPYSRESAAQALGYAGVNGASSSKVAACVHFGLLAREGNVYKQAELASKVFVSIDDEEKELALRTAFKKPALYAKLINEFNGKALPKMLDNILVRNHQITERVAKEAASAFIKSAEYAGVLSNGVLNVNAESQDSDAEPVPPADSVAQNAGVTGTTHPQAATPPAATPSVTNHLPVLIPGTQVTILFPLSYAYDLSIGTFKPGIELLAENISSSGVATVGTNDEPAPAA